MTRSRGSKKENLRSEESLKIAQWNEKECLMQIYQVVRAIGLGVFVSSFLLLTVTPSHAATYEVKMYNKDPANKKKRMVFIPRILKIKPGDTVKFISVNKGHNAQTIKGMIPSGAKKWKSKIGKDFEVTLDKPGVYGYKCTPHYGVGMVGLVVVEGANWEANLEQAKSAKKVGKAKKIFKEIWAELEASK